MRRDTQIRRRDEQATGSDRWMTPKAFRILPFLARPVAEVREADRGSVLGQEPERETVTGDACCLGEPKPASGFAGDYSA